MRTSKAGAKPHWPRESEGFLRTNLHLFQTDLKPLQFEVFLSAMNINKNKQRKAGANYRALGPGSLGNSSESTPVCFKPISNGAVYTLSPVFALECKGDLSEN